MKPKVVAFLVVLCLGLGLLVGKGFSATAKKTSADGKRVRHISKDVRVDAPGYELSRPPSAPKYRTGGTKDEADCYLISPDPEVPAVTEHDMVAPTHYEFQKNGSMGRMISVTDNGRRHVSWMWSGDVYPPGPREVRVRSKPLAGAWGGMTVCGPGAINSGYSNQTHLHDGTSVVFYHSTAAIGGIWSTLTMAGGPGSVVYDRVWDLPDHIPGAGDLGAWPKGEVLYCLDETVWPDPLNFIHIVETEGNIAAGEEQLIAYLRCYVDPGDNQNLICQTPGEAPYWIQAGLAFQADVHAFGSSCDITPVVVTGRGVVGQRVAIPYMPPVVPGDCDWLGDVGYIECEDNGDAWIAGGVDWPPTIQMITDYDGENERSYHDLSACYDYKDSLHVVWVTAGFDPANPGFYEPGEARLYHWCRENGISMITSAIYEGADAGAHNLNIAKMSISAKDPSYHPGDTYLYCIWTQFSNDDVASNGFANGDLYGSGSFDGGNTWGEVLNLTGTHTPGCIPGDCVSEHWSSMSQNMFDGDLHIEYVCDRDAGGAIMDEGTWTANHVMYMRLPEWEIEPGSRSMYEIVEPDHWYHPPIKVEPDGSRIIIFEVFSTGNEDLIYSISSDHPCILVNVPPTILPPGESAAINVMLDGTGACNGTLIAGNVILTTNEAGGTIKPVRVHAVVADDYYECPRDPETVAALDNGVLELRMNANCQMEIDDIGTFLDVHNVFFRGGVIVATSQNGDIVVGRFMGENDWRAGAQDKLYTEECDVDWEPDFWILYTKDIYIEASHLAPPSHFRWWWFEISKQVKIFTEDAPEAYKHMVIEYVRVKRKDPPIWWPDQTPFTHYEDTYIGVAMDIDCPSVEDADNLAGYDVANDIAYQVGFGRVGEHPEYNDYHAGLALADGGEPGEGVVPYGCFNVRNDQFLYPQAGWGWLDEELYSLASIPGFAIQEPASVTDRSQVFAARKIDAGTDPDAEASFTMVMAVAPNGLAELQDLVAFARDIVATERGHGIPARCGDCNGDYVVDIGDVVYLVTYLYRGGPPPPYPTGRGDANNDGVLSVGDVVYLVTFLYKSGPEPRCPGIWY